MAYTTIDDSTAHFQAKQYTGNGSTGQSITFDGTTNMQPDWLWNKVVSEADSHASFDSSRGANKILYPNVALAEGTDGNGNIQSFDSNGFTVGGNQQYANHDGATQMTWAWKANGGSTTTNDASATGVGSIDSVYQANTTAGFSIVLHTGTGSSGTIAHGLGAKPDWVLTKNRTDGSTDWANYHVGLSSAEYYIVLNSNAAQVAGSSVWGDTAPTSTVFTVGGANTKNNASGKNYVSYCFAPIQGYSKFGKYTGNAADPGNFIYTGFKPAYVMIKGIAGSNNREWFIFDNKRDVDNPRDTYVKAESTDGNANSDFADFLANGFKIRANNASYNSAETFIYMAFAESPWVTSKGVPTTVIGSG